MRILRTITGHNRGLAALLLLLAVLACNRCPPPNNGDESINRPPPGLNTSPSSSPTEPGSQVSRRNSNVTLGSAHQPEPQLLTDNDWHDLRSGDRVATDANGEAELDITGCMRIYLYKASELMRAACPKSAYRSGSVTCAVAGTSLFNNSCGSRVVIQTDAAEVVLDGTYLSVTYLPTEQLTLVWVLKGKVSVRPVVGGAERTLGEPVEVREAMYLVSVPEERRAVLANVHTVSDQALPIHQIGPLADMFNLRPWLDRVAEQAKADRIPLPIMSDIPVMNFPTSINCDCENISAGLLTKPYQQQCVDIENSLKAELARTGQLVRKCDQTASGPNAWPK
ncbi:MAG TPA: hypothetical protein VJU84_15420 [Pyrinomonadaceae bacterium]|nr:hypothetical protein [Pyrinomonadaceae bacterium]